MTKTTTRLIGTIVGSTAIALASAAIATPAFAQTVSTDNGSTMTSASSMNTSGAVIAPYPPNINFLTLGGGGFGGNGLFGGNNGLFGGTGGLYGNAGYSPFDRVFALGQLFSGGYGSGLLSNVGGVTLGDLAVLSQFFNH